MTITEFILARVAEDEEAARSAQGVDEMGDSRTYYSHEGAFRDDWGLWTFHVPPARVLAECEAMRRIVMMIAAWEQARPPEKAGEFPELTKVMHYPLHALAAIWGDHPDFDPAWRT